ncbi:MAG: hypothetical protein HQL36_05540, partial [Alphaproteobacteria bacterium]|nr:hypothetical protein [Alphaproteobacteria bacterium]
GLMVVGLMDQAFAAPLYLGLGGLSVGASTVLISAAWAETFGVRHLGAIRSLTSSMTVLSTALAPVLMGWLLDAGVTVTAILLGAAALSAMTGVGVLAPARDLRRLHAPKSH